VRLLLGCAAACLLSASAARAEEAAARSQVVWPERYPSFRIWEYVGTGALLAGSFGLRYGYDSGDEPNFRGGILFDEEVMSHGFVIDPSVSKGLRVAGDAAYIGSLVFTAAEPLLVGFVHDWYLSGQLAAMGIEAYAIYSAMLFTSQAIVRRERPATRLCDNDVSADELGINCSGNNTVRSFVGGHVGTVATAATLTCIHHAHLPLYGGGLGDAVPCAFWVGATGVVFASRTLTGKHYFSDNALGVAMGTLSGLVPYFLHYAFALPAPSLEGSAPISPKGVVVGPSPGGDGAVLSLSGLLE
jgi:hypothetical protein